MTARLQPGDQILLSDCSGRWCAVATAADGGDPVHLGYVRSEHIAPLDPATLTVDMSTVRFARTDFNQVSIVHPCQRRPNEDLPLLNSGPDYSDTSGPPPEID